MGLLLAKGTPEEALADVKSAIQFHIETFGASSFPQADKVYQIEWQRGLSRGESEGDVFSRNRFPDRAKLWQVWF